MDKVLKKVTQENYTQYFTKMDKLVARNKLGLEDSLYLQDVLSDIAFGHIAEAEDKISGEGATYLRDKLIEIVTGR